jgi:hypothetical protein
LNEHGAAVGWADTAIADPFPTFCFNADCLVSHAFVSRNGVRTDLGTLPGGASSHSLLVNKVEPLQEGDRHSPIVDLAPRINVLSWMPIAISKTAMIVYQNNKASFGEGSGCGFETVPFSSAKAVGHRDSRKF